MNVVILSTLCLVLLVSTALAQSSEYKDWSDYKPGVSNPDEWYVVGAGDNFTTLLRPSSIKRQVDVVEFWSKFTHDSKGEEVMQLRSEVDCKLNKRRDLTRVDYWAWDASDDGIRLRYKLPMSRQSNNPYPEWAPIPPDSVIEKVKTAVCSTP